MGPHTYITVHELKHPQIIFTPAYNADNAFSLKPSPHRMTLFKGEVLLRG